MRRCHGLVGPAAMAVAVARGRLRSAGPAGARMRAREIPLPADTMRVDVAEQRPRTAAAS